MFAQILLWVLRYLDLYKILELRLVNKEYTFVNEYNYLQETFFDDINFYKLQPLFEKKRPKFIYDVIMNFGFELHSAVRFENVLYLYVNFPHIFNKITKLKLYGDIDEEYETEYDISQFQNLHHLETVYLDIKVSSPIMLGSLRTLILNECVVEDVSFLSYCTNLKSLEFSDTYTISTEPLKDLTNITNLCLVGVDNIDFVEKLTLLSEFYLMSSKVHNIEPLKNCTKLRKLRLSGTCVQDISVLKNCKELKWLDLTSTLVENIDALKECTNLVKIDLCDTYVSNYTPLTNLQKLEKKCIWHDRYLFSEDNI